MKIKFLFILITFLIINVINIEGKKQDLQTNDDNKNDENNDSIIDPKINLQICNANNCPVSNDEKVEIKSKRAKEIIVEDLIVETNEQPQQLKHCEDELKKVKMPIENEMEMEMTKIKQTDINKDKTKKKSKQTKQKLTETNTEEASYVKSKSKREINEKNIETSLDKQSIDEQEKINKESISEKEHKKQTKKLKKNKNTKTKKSKSKSKSKKNEKKYGKKTSGVSKRRKKAGSFHYKRSNKLKRQRLRELRKCGPINCDVVRQSWDHKKSLVKNMKNMGLAEDPNKLLSGTKFHEKFKNPALNNDQKDGIVQRLHKKLEKNHRKLLKKKIKKSNEFDVEMEIKNNDKSVKSVTEKLSELASKPMSKNFRFGPDQIKFCAYMIEKYGDNYEAMCRDKRNYYQESVGQIRSKIQKFLSIKSHRNVYEMAIKMCDAKFNNENDV